MKKCFLLLLLPLLFAGCSKEKEEPYNPPSVYQLYMINTSQMKAEVVVNKIDTLYLQFNSNTLEWEKKEGKPLRIEIKNIHRNNLSVLFGTKWHFDNNSEAIHDITLLSGQSRVLLDLD